VLERGPAVVRETVRERPLYVSIDLDVLDASVAPGHSLPEPGGLSYRELRALLNPALDPSGMTARVAAWIATHFLREIFDQSG
jgi:arginase family enzyme